MKKLIYFVLALFLVTTVSGCANVQKKFTRKKKETVKMPRVYQPRKYEKKPTPELYKKHFSYWESWQSELIKVLGQNHKKDTLCIEQIISNLKDMQDILVPEKGDELTKHIERLMQVKDVIYRESGSHADKGWTLSTLDRESRYIKREFQYNKVKGYLKQSFDEMPDVEAPKVEAPKVEASGSGE